jgi:hypothetical protein
METNKEAYHIGIAVPDLHGAMAELSEALGLHWAQVERNEFSVRTAQGVQLVPLAYTFSVEGPPHLELIQGPEGSTWCANEGAFVHHIGFWADDVPGSAGHLERLGMPMEMTSGNADTPSVFTYHESRYGFRIELVDSERRTRTSQWLGRSV